jgi:hypothetical protein
VILINKAIIKGKSDRAIASQFGVTRGSLFRHRTHVAALLQRGKERETEKQVDVVMETRADLVEKARKVWQACDDFLTDPDNPDRYTLAPRTQDIEVIYEAEEDRESHGDPDDEDSNVKVKRVKVRKKAMLSELLAGIPNVFNVTWRTADPRKLVLDAIARLESLAQYEARLMGRLKDATPAAVTVNQQINYYAIMPVVFEILKKHPAALKAVTEAADAHFARSP